MVHCGLVAGDFKNPDECAKFFRLDPSSIRELYSPDQARRVLRLILQRDLAYDSPILKEEEAERLIASFAEASRLDESDTRIFGNVETGGFEDGPPARLRGWIPATSATFDTGVLTIARDRCACLWVEDED